MKTVVFMGDSLARIRAFPSGVRQDAGFQIDRIQRGDCPDDWKPMKTIGKGVREIRIKEASGHFRIAYLANLKDAVYVLHAFQKKTRQTRKTDIELARRRLREIGESNG
jgi:phage-related protein